MICIDCESKESALLSMAEVFNTNVLEIQSIFESNDFSTMYMSISVDEYGYITFEKYLFQYFQKNFGEPNCIDYVCWFHLSRSMTPENYKKQILPLDKIRPLLFKNLYDLVKDEISPVQWNEIYEKGASGYNNRLYIEKIQNKKHYGPYAMLVKDIAFYSQESCNHNYLAIPEIIEDIAIGIQETYKINLAERFMENSKSVIVKFKKAVKNEEQTDNYISNTLCYLYYSLRDESLSGICNTCTDNKGITIEEVDILEVKILENYI